MLASLTKSKPASLRRPALYAMSSAAWICVDKRAYGCCIPLKSPINVPNFSHLCKYGIAISWRQALVMPNCCAATSKEASTKKKETYRRIASVKRNDALPIVEYIRTNTNPHFVQDIDAILVSNSNSSQHIFGIDLLVFKDNRAPRRCLETELVFWFSNGQAMP